MAERPDDLFERTLDRLYPALKATEDLHSVHEMAGGNRCDEPSCQHEHHGPMCLLNDRCDELSEAMGEMVDAGFPPETAEAFLASGPPDLLDWTSGNGGLTVREFVVSALREEAGERLWPNYSPRLHDPATTWIVEE